MNKILVCVVFGACAGIAHASSPNKVQDAALPAKPGDVKMLGRLGDLFRSSLDHRVYSDHARGPVYDEAEHAFATHWDDNPNGGRGAGWQNEYWGKTMLCYAGAIRHTGDKSLAAWCLDKAHRFIDTYQHEDGYLSTYGNQDLLRQNPDSPDWEHHWCFNIWGQKYTMWALVELYRATGDRKCLKAAERMTDQIVAQLKRLNITIDQTGAWAGISSMSILRPLLELYREVPKPEYRELADYIVRVTDVSIDPRPEVNLIYDALSDRPVVSWFRKPIVLSKAYELLSCFEGVADYYRLTGNERTLNATESFWGHLYREELNPMRSAGYFDHFLYAKKHVNGMTELCDVTHWIRLNRELWRLTGETKYLDCIEEAFYNAFLAGVSPEGDWSAHIVRSHGTRHLSAPAQTGMKLHQCCPDNMLRTFYDWADTVADISKDGAYELNLYSDADVELPGATFELRGNYPISGRLRIRASLKRPGRLRLRVPYWAETLSVDGRELRPMNGRVEIGLTEGETSLVAAFPMAPRIITSEAPDVEDIDTVSELDPHKPMGYTKRFMSWYTPEMEGLARRTPAAQIMRGPIVLAKGRVVGTSRNETFDFLTINGDSRWKVSLAPAKHTAANNGVWGAWKLTLEKGDEKRDVPVADYWSASRLDDPSNWFSIWF
jgi:hypothetical protein